MRGRFGGRAHDSCRAPGACRTAAGCRFAAGSRRPMPCTGAACAGRFWTPADGSHVPPVTPPPAPHRRPGRDGARARRRIGAPAGAATGGTEYGAASQTPTPAPAPAPSPGGVDPSQPLPSPSPARPSRRRRPGQVARVLPSGMAVAPTGAPAAVQQIIAAGNRIARTKYVWGGGHRRWEDRGYDCSGSVSYALRGAGAARRAARQRRPRALGRRRSRPVGDDLRQRRPRLHDRRGPAVRHVRAAEGRQPLAGGAPLGPRASRCAIPPGL